MHTHSRALDQHNKPSHLASARLHTRAHTHTHDLGIINRARMCMYVGLELRILFCSVILCPRIKCTLGANLATQCTVFCACPPSPKSPPAMRQRPANVWNIFKFIPNTCSACFSSSTAAPHDHIAIAFGDGISFWLRRATTRRGNHRFYVV